MRSYELKISKNLKKSKEENYTKAQYNKIA